MLKMPKPPPSAQQTNSQETDTQENGSPGEAAREPTDGEFWVGLARAFAGAVLFSISLMMTMEMWWLGFYMDRARLALFTGVNVLLLVGLARYRGFRKNVTWLDSVIDAFVGYAVGVITGMVVLALIGQISRGMSADEIIGKVALQAIAGSIGALLARGQLGGSTDGDTPPPGANYGAELFLTVAGALLLAFTLAPTEEMIVIGYSVTSWHAILMVLISLMIMHTFVYMVDFHGQEQVDPDTSFWSLFLRYTVVGYVCVFLTSLYILWTFGRAEGTTLPPLTMTAVVLSLPGALGAAAARLIL